MWGNVETMEDFIFLGSKITVDGDCSHKIKRYLFLGRKAMTNLDSVLKSRDITLLTKDMSLTELQEIVKDREAWRAASVGLQRVRHDSVTERQQQDDILTL